jgi:serine protease Do
MRTATLTLSLVLCFQVVSAWPQADVDVGRRTAIVRAAERAGPAVVAVTVTQVVEGYRRVRDPFFDQWGFLFPRYQYSRYKVSNFGSGFIVDSSGHVITNEHVVEGAVEVQVTLPDGRSYDAEIVGQDRINDIAVLKIDSDGLPVAPLGGSDDLIIGEWVVAIGNPFGYLLRDTKPTVTVGVVSAVNRDVRPDSDKPQRYRSLIQTDAAINPGNSGGPLVNTHGEVIGINTFIFSKSGGSIGMGFAIPIDIAKRVIEELTAYGKVREVWVGLRVQEIDQLLARSLELDRPEGVLVSSVSEGSPADKAGVKRGDVLIEIDGRRVESVEDAREAMAARMVGEHVPVTVSREGRLMDLVLVLEELR